MEVAGEAAHGTDFIGQSFCRERPNLRQSIMIPVKELKAVDPTQCPIQMIFDRFCQEMAMTFNEMPYLLV